MRWFDRLRGRRNGAVTRNFSIQQPFASVDDAMMAAQIGASGPVARALALSVPAVLRGRNMLCGAISSLPLVCRGPDNVIDPNPLLADFDPDIANSVHIAMTVEDLVLSGVSYWEVMAYGWDGYPVSVRRRDPSSVSLVPPISYRSLSPLPSGIDPRGASVWVDGREVSARDIIQFHSPNRPVLEAGADIIRRALALGQAAKRSAIHPTPATILSSSDGADPEPAPGQTQDDAIRALLEGYRAAVAANGEIYQKAGLNIAQVPTVNPRELQLVELSQECDRQICELFGIDPEEVGLNVTSRTYFNAQDRQQSKINEVYSPYMRAITDRLNKGDVTKRGYTTEFLLDGYLRADPLTRATVQKTYVDMGVLGPQEVRDVERIPGNVPSKPKPPAPPVPPPVDQQPAPAPADNVPPTQQAQQEVTVAASRKKHAHAHAFAARTKFVDLPLATFSVDTESRTITGVAVPYGNAQGNGYRFERGALQWSADVSRVKLNLHHDDKQTVGVATEIRDSPAGLMAKFRVPATPAGDAALTLASEGVLDGLSIEADFEDATDTVADPRNKGGLLVKRAQLVGAALTGNPAFEGARVTRVAMSKEDTVEDETEETSTAVETPTTPPAPQQFERPVIKPVAPVATLAVREPSPYQFTRKGALVRGSHDLFEDLVAFDRRHDLAAYDRAMAFMKQQFADAPIAVTDVDELVPAIQYPRYVDELEYTYPLWSRVGRGAPPNGINTFSWPKFSTSAIAVATHVTGTDPDSKGYTTTKQDVTPVAKSGRVQIPREVWDMGGTPGISDLIWRKVTRAWGEHREAVIDAALDAGAASMTALATFTALGGGAAAHPYYPTLVKELEAGIATLNFARGGFRFEVMATQADHYAQLAAATDSSGRKLYPMLSPMNANGTAATRYSRLTIAGVDFVPSWAGDAAGQAVATNSYLFDPTAVDAWATEPQRVDITHTLSYVDIAVWGYMVAAINDLAGTRKMVYKPA